MGRDDRTRKRNQERAKAAQLSKPHPKGQLSTQTEAGVSYNIWALESPTGSYFADACAFSYSAGVPTLYFGQTTPVSHALMNAIGIAVPRVRFQALMEAFGLIRSELPDRIERVFKGVPQHVLPLDNLTNENFRKFEASLIRGTCSDEAAMLDFYAVEVFSQERLANCGADSLISPVVRISMSPLALDQLFKEIESHGI